MIPEFDPGHDDGDQVQPDVFGLSIDYYDGDYARTNTPTPVAQQTPYGGDLYNGNIKGLRFQTHGLPPSSGDFHTYTYGYNKNNWLANAVYGQGDEQYMGDGIYKVDFTPDPNQDYYMEGIVYDANGNITNLYRNGYTDGNGTNEMDMLSYSYDGNKLHQVADSGDNPDPSRYNDIRHQADSPNYIYNTIGQLVYNKQDELSYEYYTNGLVKRVLKGESPHEQPLVEFYYNDRGQRVKKTGYAYNVQGDLLAIRETYYVRDAIGNVTAVYEHIPEETFQLTEQPVYGLNRLGVYYRTIQDEPIFAIAYELTDHLGNVRAVIMKNHDETVNLLGATDYYPFGMPMPNRHLQGDYRYAFQGQEKDPETGMEAFELRLWDSRIGRWLTPDPYRQFHSPYLGMGNNPITMIDPDGGYTCDTPPCLESDLGSERWFNFLSGTWEYSGLLLDEILLTFSGNGNRSTTNFMSGLSFTGSIGVDIFNSTIPNINKTDFLLGRVDPKNATDFLNKVPNSAMGNIYEKGYKESLNSINNLKIGTKYLSSAFNVLSYYEAAESVSEGNFSQATGQSVKATGSVISNYVPIVGPVLYEGTFYLAETFLVRSEGYNSLIHGKNSQTYKERGLKYGYITTRFERIKF